MENNNTNIGETEIEISSVSNNAKEEKTVSKKAPQDPLVSTGLSIAVKVISFIVSFAVIAVFMLISFILYNKEPLFEAISIALMILGIVIGTIIMILIYGLGHIISQNNEILRRFNKYNDK